MASLIYGLAGKLLGELCSPVFQDYVGKPWVFGTNDEFEKLKNTLSAIEAVLLDAEEKQRTNHQVRDWLIKIKLVFYDLEDLLQEISTEALKRQVMTKNKRAKKVRIFFSSSNQVKYRLKIGRKVKLIRERLDAIASDRSRFNLTERREEMHVGRDRRREESHSFVPLDKFIGRDEDKNDVKKLLLESDALDNVSVISIVGIGGVGKTTLAQSIYSLEEVKKKFKLMMWVCVSDVFDLKLICEKIIESATANKCERLQMDGVKDELKKAIDGRKYLLVLDDVWNKCPVEWMKLEDLLSNGARGSRILITARAELVARAARSIATHSLKGLSKEESWALFEKVAFKRGVETKSKRIVEIGKEVVKVCAGVPLAIKTIGCMLGLKEKETDWLDFHKNDLPLITQDSEGYVAPILKRSYDFLSAPLKRCFAHCAVLPKDYKFEKERLIGMWMAQGLIQLDGTSRSFEDVGEQHFMDLLDRSFFEEDHIDPDIGGDCKVCIYKMHDLIHDLALSVGGNEYYNLGSDANCIDKLTRHACAPVHVTPKLLDAKQLRTLVTYSRERDELFVTYSLDRDGHKVNEIMSVFKKLRLLDLERLNIARVPHVIDGLRHLSYLNLAGNNFDVLPESICSLYNLQTLILSDCDYLKDLPAGTRKLVSLRHLDVNGCNKLSHMPRGLDELTNLHTLRPFVTGPEGRNCCELGELKSLVNLRGKLEIRNLRGSKVVKCTEDRRFHPDVLTQLKSIQHLELVWSRWSNEDVVMAEVVWSMWSNEDVVMEEEGQLVLFESLRPQASDQLFPSLKELKLWSMRKLRRFVGPRSTLRLNNKRHFPVLEKLCISECPILVADGTDEEGMQFIYLPLRQNSITKLRVIRIKSRRGSLIDAPVWLGGMSHFAWEMEQEANWNATQ